MKHIPARFYLLILFIFAVLAGGIFIPKIVIREAADLSPEEIACAKNEAHLMLDNPFERALVLKLAASGKEGKNIYVDAYTFWGLKYAKIRVVCNDSAEVLWRVWRKQIPLVSTFEECTGMGYPIAESYPRQCWTPDGRRFVEEITPPAGPSNETCANLCGDGICQEVVCRAIGCPCPETPETCPTDCKQTNYIFDKSKFCPDYGDCSDYGLESRKCSKIGDCVASCAYGCISKKWMEGRMDCEAIWENFECECIDGICQRK